MAHILKSTTLAYATQYYRDRSFKSSCPEVFCKKGVLKNFDKFTGKPMCQRPFFNKVAGLKPTILLKERLAQVFFGEFCENSKNTFYYRTPLVTASD